MRVKILYDVKMSGEHLDAGEVIDVPEDEAQRLTVDGKAELFTDEPGDDDPGDDDPGDDSGDNQTK